MTERFNVVRRPAREAVRPVATTRSTRSPGGPRGCATPASARRCTGGCSSSPSASSARSARRRSTASARQLVVSGTLSSGTLVALAALVVRVYAPAHRADQRPGRPDDRDRQLRAGVRGARRAGGDHRPARRDRRWSTPRGRVELDDVWFRYPPAAERHGRLAGGARGASAAPTPTATCCAASSLDDRAGRDGRPRRPVRARARPRSPALIPRLYDVTAGAVRVDGHDVRDAHPGLAARRDRRGAPGPAPVPRVDRRQPALRQARRHRRRARGGLPRRRASTT